jgi:DNA-binding MarR family transcriptional regulator
MDLETRRNLQALEAIAEDDHITQRTLASKLDIALGLANLYLKRLIRKGYIKCVNVQSNRVRYLLTPTGITEKTRLTYAFMEYSLRVFREGRNHLKWMLKPYVARENSRIAIFGTGEAAELVYLCLRELGLEPAAVFDSSGNAVFFQFSVRSPAEIMSIDFDALIVATFSDPAALADMLVDLGVAPEKLIMLREPLATRADRATAV